VGEETGATGSSTIKLARIVVGLGVGELHDERGEVLISVIFSPESPTGWVQTHQWLVREAYARGYRVVGTGRALTTRSRPETSIHR